MAIILPETGTANPFNNLRQPSSGDRDGFLVDILVNGISLLSIGYIDFLNSFYVDQSVDRIDRLQLEFFNEDRTDEIVFSEGNEINFFLGYSTTSLVSLGIFVVSSVKYNFGKGANRIVVNCYGEAVKMTLEQKRRSFYNASFSSIINSIAPEYSFVTDIETVSETIPQVMQTNESDYELIKKFANSAGFVFYVYQGELHFHKVRSSTDDKYNTNILLDLSNPNDFMLKDVSIDVFGIGRYFNDTITRIDPTSGQIISLSQNTVTDIDSILNPIATNIKAPSQIGTTASRFFLPSGISNSLAELQRHIENKKFFSNFVVRLCATVSGIEELKHDRLVTIEGINRFSGVYYISSVRHEMRGGGFGKEAKQHITKIDCWKKFTDPTAGFSPVTDYFGNFSFNFGEDITSKIPVE